MSRQTNLSRQNLSLNERQDQATSDQTRAPNVQSLADAVADALMQSITTAVHRTTSPRNLEPAGVVSTGSSHPSSHQTSHSGGCPDGQHIEDPTSQSPQSIFRRAADMRHQSTISGCKRPRYEPPSMFENMRRGNRRTRKADMQAAPKTIHYVRDIILLPPEYRNSQTGDVSIPRTTKRSILGSAGLVGKVELDSSMTENEVRREICEVFSGSMGLTTEDIKSENLFPFIYLQRAGSGSRSLCVPSVKPTFEWNGKRVSSLAKAGAYIYILAEKDLPGYQRMVRSCIAIYTEPCMDACI